MAIGTLQLREKFRQILVIKDSPGLLALSFSTGIFIGMSPLLGIHTLLGVIVAWRFRLNKLVTLLGVYITNPWTIIPIYSFGTWFGVKLLGIHKVLPEVDWTSVTFLDLIGKCRKLVLPFIVGNTVMGAIAAFIGYWVIYHAVKKSRG